MFSDSRIQGRASKVRSPSIQVGTLKLTHPVGWTFLRAAAILVCIIGSLEVAGRTGVILPYVLRPMISGHVGIGPRLEMIADIERTEGPIDCFLIGSSIVYRGIDPRIISQALTAGSGRTTRCYIFGLAGLNYTGATRLAAILATRYHPRLIIYPLNYRDSHGFNLKVPWANQQLGEPSFQGWMESESMTYRYLLGLGPEAMPLQPLLPPDYSYRYGFIPTNRKSDVSEVPVEGGFYQTWKDFQRRNRDVLFTRLDSFLSLKSTGVSLVIVSMPVPPSVLRISADEARTYQEFIRRLSDESWQRGVPFVPAPPDSLIPANGWKDYLHMNQVGADAYSPWLGGQLVDLMRQGAISDAGN